MAENVINTLIIIFQDVYFFLFRLGNDTRAKKCASVSDLEGEDIYVAVYLIARHLMIEL